MLKRLFPIISLLLVFSSAAVAQFEIGANAGTSISATNLNLQGRDLSNLVGFYPEVDASYQFAKHFSANLGVGFTQRGFREQPEGEGKRQVRLRYFTLPVYATAGLPLGQKLRGGVSAGFQFNFFNSADATPPYNVDPQHRNNPVSFLFGSELGYMLSDKFWINLRYRLATDFGEADDVQVLGRLHSHYVMLGLSYVLAK